MALLTIDDMQTILEHVKDYVDEKAGISAEENFVLSGRVFLGGTYIDEEGGLHMPTATCDEDDESITIK